MSAVTPTLILVHGAFHGPGCWSDIVSRLRAAGIEARTVDLPSGAAAAEGPTLHDDAEAIRREIEAVDGPVLVVAHSYGGLPASEGATGVDGLVGIVYVCAMVPELGDSSLGLMGGEPPDSFEFSADRTTVFPGEVDTFYSEVAPGPRQRLVDELRPQSFASLTTGVEAIAWPDVPTTYVLTDLDIAFPAEVQEFFAARTDRSRHVDADHSPFASRPAELVEILVEAARDGGP
jgi:pimeloyl-ACP methyl ester carboxylesterase